MARSLQGQTALITGGAKRIGRETALALAAEGVSVIVHYNRSSDEAEALAADLREFDVQAWTVQADFAVVKEYESLFERALELSGGIDILINNASIFPAEKLQDMTWQSLQSNIEINTWVPFVLSREFARRTDHGTIINLHDSRLKGYDWNHTGYILSKHLLAVLTRMMALDFAPNITVNAVAPGLILPPPGKDISYIEALKDTVPLKKHGNPQDIADAIVYLVKSDYITGEVIYVDGGRHLQEYLGGQNPH